MRKSSVKYRLVYSKSAKKLTSASLSGYRWRIGVYRVIFDLNKNRIRY